MGTMAYNGQDGENGKYENKWIVQIQFDSIDLDHLNKYPMG